MNRREVLIGTAAGLALGSAAGADEGTGPFSLPSARFAPGKQHELPPGAFETELPRPLVARPTAVGTYDELTTGALKNRAFGPGDPHAIGDCFHGVALEWGATPAHWRLFQCNPDLTVPAECWKDKAAHFGTIPNHDPSDPLPNIPNWGGAAGGFKIKCYKIPILEALHPFRRDVPTSARVYGFAGMVPGPSLKMRLGQPVVVRFENHLETEVSVHLHGGHSPSHSDGFPSFYVLQGKTRDYFYPNILPLRDSVNGSGQTVYKPDGGESQSTMWYHDHAMDATAYNVSKGLAGFAPCFGENELALLRERILPGLGTASCVDPERDGLKMVGNVPDPSLEDPHNPGFYKRALGAEPYFNPYDIPLVLQDKVIDPRTGQIAYDNTGHNGYLGDTFLVNGAGWPRLTVRNRKYRFRILDGSNARIFRLRLMKYEDFVVANRVGIDAAGAEEEDPRAVLDRPGRYEALAQPFLRIGKDSWLWRRAARRTSMVLAMANRADIVIDFGELAAGLRPGEERAFVLVNTMPQANGRGPKAALEDGGDPRVLPLPFDALRPDPNDPTRQIPVRLVELNRPIGLMKIVVQYGPPGSHPDDPAAEKADHRDASVGDGTLLLRPPYGHNKITDDEIKVVRQFIFKRTKGAWVINNRFYDPTIANACPTLNGAEEWILENGGGGWWHPIHIHLESHQIVQYEKDFEADDVVDAADPPAQRPIGNPVDVTAQMDPNEVDGFHDTQVLGPNTRVRIRMRHRTWFGPFVFHCHNLEHEDMRMMYNFEPVPSPHDPNAVPDARTHGDDVTFGDKVGELPWEYPVVPAVPSAPLPDAGISVVPPRPGRRNGSSGP